MKKILNLFALVFMITCFSSCSFFQGIFGGGNKKGCPTNGKNIGAERLMSGDPKAEKEAKKAGKFKQSKF